MKNSILIAVAMLLPAVPALAQTAVPVGHGATAGRSPHQAYSTVAAKPSCAHTVMHSIPAGKLPTYGTHALPAAGCADAQIASTSEPKSASARD
jgi:hypothetical protein